MMSATKHNFVSYQAQLDVSYQARLDVSYQARLDVSFKALDVSYQARLDVSYQAQLCQLPSAARYQLPRTTMMSATKHNHVCYQGKLDISH